EPRSHSDLHHLSPRPSRARRREAEGRRNAGQGGNRRCGGVRDERGGPRSNRSYDRSLCLAPIEHKGHKGCVSTSVLRITCSFCPLCPSCSNRGEMRKELSYLDAIREALQGEMRRDPKVFVLGEDVGAYGGAFGVTQGLYEEFGEMRVVDTPISESAII